MSKLDKIKFGRVVGHCVSQGMTAGDWEIEKLDELITFDVEPQHIVNATPDDIDRLMYLMTAGNEKLEAIKLYRKLTGFGLKESKDAVEKYWPVAKPTENQIAAKLMACFACDEDKAYDVARQLVELR